MHHRLQRGFTLIELSIVLVIIGLIVGGVLVGQDLIRSAAIRATISQVEQFNTAVNTFHGKYNAIPGDMNASTAQSYGFAAVDFEGTARGFNGLAGTGDGNGIIEGIGYGGATGPGYVLSQFSGETGFFWSDLTYAHGQNINLVPLSVAESCLPFIADFAALGCFAGLSSFSQYLPAARLGNGNFFYVYSNAGYNYYGISVLQLTTYPVPGATPGLTVSQAYNIDKKVDDGTANSGNVQASYVQCNTCNGVGVIGFSPSAASGSYTSTTCFDSASGAYALKWGQGGGNNVACGLSFKMQ